MLASEDLDNIKEEKPKEEQIKITPQTNQEEKPKEELTSQPGVPKEEIKAPEKPLAQEEIILKKKAKEIKKKRKKHAPPVYKSKIIKIDGKKALVIPSGFEIKTSEGWGPLMMRADKIGTGK